MNIRRIIREEISDFDWVRSSDPIADPLNNFYGNIECGNLELLYNNIRRDYEELWSVDRVLGIEKSKLGGMIIPIDNNHIAKQILSQVFTKENKPSFKDNFRKIKSWYKNKLKEIEEKAKSCNFTMVNDEFGSRNFIKESNDLQKYEHVDVVHMAYFPSTNQVLDREDWLEIDEGELPDLNYWDYKEASYNTQWYYHNGFLDKYWKPDELLKEIKTYYQDMADQFEDEDREYFQQMSDEVTIRSFIIRAGIEEIKTDSSFFDKF